MCQAYEAEKRLFNKIMGIACIKGFAAARAGKLKKLNPYHKLYEKGMREMWDDGWECWRDKILPWALEVVYHERGDVIGGAEARISFKKNRFLPHDLESIVECYRA
ncbi:MAG: hypothetical protein A2745_01180 [Candidatus Harrisonbacteria bacterium RIFCSPHIGHO2_01_FULL_44_13]|uniref:Uncharacterized protein n=1 Tax=Candidatus Harrisonbacteria bacterium RIFCSPLOWO2_01_FULL_44_18 TaxID=1798407 RepID=A0A1G1ZMS3_9BACT|nr:MAG: hypothetical protein A2745_01180 [Candidatus Harrisonbacteria bacterium RIFCSPHIGHO2_01_FULL_44_13]OGY65699.1 MAG: hypothetical protein A3A16_03730 [Candidatus Harrisonbacteria bacterium RIFCSPLOWO2_01_FULL_44_18]